MTYISNYRHPNKDHIVQTEEQHKCSMKKTM